MEIKVYGSSGCKKCSKLKKKIEKIVEREGREDIEVIKVEDMMELAQKGIMSTPAVSVDDEVKFAGQAPTEEEIKQKLL